MTERERFEAWLSAQREASPLQSPTLFDAWCAALSAPAVPQWMPIETAPKDGTAILLGSKGGSWIGKWLPVYQSGYVPDCKWSSLMLNHDHMAEKRQPPTHWMPLPLPPAAPSAKDPTCPKN